MHIAARIPLPTPYGGHLPPGGRDWVRRLRKIWHPCPRLGAGVRGGESMEEYTKADYIRFIGELLELLPVGFVKKIYSICANERKRAGV